MEDYYGIKSRRAREYIRSLPFKKKIPWKAMFPKSSDLALDLLERLLAFNPVKRINVEEALKQHEYIPPPEQQDYCLCTIQQQYFVPVLGLVVGEERWTVVLSASGG